MAIRSVGNFLREQRLAQGLTLEAVSASTRISVKCLDAIETDYLLNISSAFLYKSFARQFAATLHVEYSQIEESVNVTAEFFPKPLMPGQESHGPKVPALRGSRSIKVRWAVPVLSLAAVLVGCSGLYALWQRTQTTTSAITAPDQQASEPKPATVARASSVQSAEGTPVPSARAEIPEQAAEKASEAAVPVAAATLTGLELKISAVEKTWVSVDADGKRIYSGLLEAADTKVLEGHETARIRTGNAGGIEVVFNGKDIGTLGERGQVMTVVFTRSNYEVVEPHLSAQVRFTPVSNVTE